MGVVERELLECGEAAALGCECAVLWLGSDSDIPRTVSGNGWECYMLRQ